MSYLLEQSQTLERELGIFVYYNRNVSSANSTTYTCVLPPGTVNTLQSKASENLLISSSEWFDTFSYFSSSRQTLASSAAPSQPENTPETGKQPNSSPIKPDPIAVSPESFAELDNKSLHLHLEDCVADGDTVDVTVVPKTSPENALSLLSSLLACPPSPHPTQTPRKKPHQLSLYDYLEELEQIGRYNSNSFERAEVKTIGGAAVSYRFVQLLAQNELSEETIKAFLSLILIAAHKNNPESEEESDYFDHRRDPIDGHSFVNPHVQPLLKVVEGPSSFYLISQTFEVDLQVVLSSCQKMFRNINDRLFLCYQLVQALRGLHQAGVCHGNLHPRCIGLEHKLPWVRLCAFGFPSQSSGPSAPNLGEELWQALQKWRNREIGNFEYLLILNNLAGRRYGDPNFHPVVPWVIDFKTPYSFRDLSKSKFRLTKGDDQLDQTYTSDEPHHITNLLTDLTYYSYKARCTPISVLKKFVRSQFVPKEYPDSIERMYKWSPDEAIPEFFTDPSVFQSIHPSMPDLHVPSWAGGQVTRFLKMHRELMESDYVSNNLHLWIDLTFGYQLSGAAAVSAKNVPLSTSRHVGGFVQLFAHPHPTRFEIIPQPVENWAAHLVSADAKVLDDATLDLINQFDTTSFAASSPGPPLVVHADLISSPTVSNRRIDPLEIPDTKRGSTPQSVDRLTKSGTAFERLKARIGSMRAQKKQKRAMRQVAQPPSQFSDITAKNFHLNEDSSNNLLSFSMANSGGHRFLLEAIKTADHSPLFQSDSSSSSEEEEFVFASSDLASRSAPSLLSDELFDQHDDQDLDDLDDSLEAQNHLSRVPSLGISSSFHALREAWESPISSLLGVEMSLSERRNFLRLIPAYKLPSQLADRFNNVFIKGIADDTFSLGIILSHILSGTMLVDAASLADWSSTVGQSLPDSISRRLTLLPSINLRYFIEALLTHPYDGIHYIAEMHSDCFPRWFEQVHNILSMYYMLTSWNDRVAYCLQLTTSLTGLPTGGILLLLPHFQPLFQFPDTRLASVDLLSNLTDLLADTQLCHEYFASYLMAMMDQLSDVGLQQKILSASFLQTLPAKFGMAWFLDYIIPHLINALFATVQSVADVACNSLTKLTPLLGPVIAMRRLLMPAIALLTRPQTSVVVRVIVGISTHMGTEMIVQHIIPQLYHLLQEHSSRVSKGPRVLLSVLSTLNELLELLDKSAALQTFIIKSSLLFSIFLNPSPQSCEASQPALIRFLAKVSSYIGLVHTKTHVLPYISQYLANYDGLYSKRGTWIGRETDKVLRTIYSIEIASLIYREFTALIDRQTLLEEIPNFLNIESMIHVNHRHIGSNASSNNRFRVSIGGEEDAGKMRLHSASSNSALPQTRHSIATLPPPALDSHSSPHLPLTTEPPAEPQPQLKWTTSLPFGDFPKKFSGKVAAVLRGGHASGIRSMAHYNEQVMLTGSRDTTVRWWTIDDPRSAKRVYTKHKQMVSSVGFLDGGRLAMSAASSVHLWNPETLTTVHTFNPDPDPFVCAVPLHPNSLQFTACSTNALYNIDPLCHSLRSNTFQNVWSLDSQTSGQIRCVARVPSINAIATGSSTGHITLIDLRSGIVLFSWKGHDGPVLMIDSHESRLISSSADRTLATWNLLSSPPKLDLARWGHSDVVSSFALYDNHTILSTSGSKLGVISTIQNPNINRIAKVSKMPLFNAKAEKISSLISLPSHGVVIMGTEDGAIRIGF